MFDDFVLPSQKNKNNNDIPVSPQNTKKGMFDDFVLPSQKPIGTPLVYAPTETTTPQVTPNALITPTVTESKKSFMDRDLPSFIKGYGASGVSRLAGATEEIFFKGLGAASKFGSNIASKVYGTVGKAVDILGGSDDNIFNRVADDFYNNGIKTQQLYNKLGRDISHMYSTMGEEFKESALSPSEGYQKYVEKGQTDTEFNWKDVGSKEFLMYDLMGNLVENAPTMLASLYATKGLGGVGPIGSKLYQYSKLANQLGTGTSISNGINAFVEGETAFDQALQNNLSENEAIKRFNNVVDRNFGTNTALEMTQLLSIFAPSVNTSSKFLNTLIKVGRVAYTGLAEAGQERLEDKIQETAGNEELKIKELLSSLWKKGITKTDAISFVTGMLFQGMGNVFVSETKLKKASEIKAQSILDNLPPTVPPPSTGGPVEKLDKLMDTNPDEVATAISRSNRQIKNSTSVIENRKIEEDAKSSVLDIDSATIIQQALQDNELDSTLSDMKSKQALNEAGITLEETKTPETVTEQPKLKISKEEPLITEAKKYKSAEEFVKAQPNIAEYSPLTDQTTQRSIKILNESGIPVKSGKDILTLYHGTNEKGMKGINESGTLNPFSYLATDKRASEGFAFGNNGGVLELKVPVKDAGFVQTSMAGAKGVTIQNPVRLIKGKDGIWRAEQWKTKSQLIDIYNKAQGEAKMKIKIESTKKLLAKIDQDIAGNIDYLIKEADLLSKKGKLRLSELSDLEEIQAKVIKNKLTKEDRLLYNEIAKKLGREDLLPTNTLDIENAKIDNKEYGENKTTTNGEVRNNIRDLRQGNEGDSRAYPLENRSKDGELRSTGGQNESGKRVENSRISQGKSTGEVRRIVESVFPEAQKEVIDEIILSNIILNNIGIELEIQRSDTLNGRTDFDAGIQNGKRTSLLTLNNKYIATIKKNSIWHEVFGHKWYQNLTYQQKELHFNKIKELYNSNKTLFDKFLAKEYWETFAGQSIRNDIINANPGISDIEIDKILVENGFLNENNEIIYPESVLDTVFNFTPMSDKLNKYLKGNGYNPSIGVLEYNNLMGEEINSYVAENAKIFKDSTIPEISQYSNAILNGTIKLSDNLGFGGQRFKLRQSTGLTSEDIIKKHANIQLKRDIVITDVYGEKATLKAGEGITPYEVTGNKFILQDGEAYLVSKSQAQNVINNSKTGEAKPFAPELKQTEEIQSPINKSIGKSNFMTWILPGGENYREILIKATDEPKLAELKKPLNDYLEILKEKYGSLTGKLDYTPAEIKKMDELGAPVRDFKRNNIKPVFKSSHWDEPNVISHIRMNERTYNGKKVAFMEELQSDFAREQRKQQKDNLDIIDSKWDSLLDEMSNDGILSVVC